MIDMPCYLFLKTLHSVNDFLVIMFSVNIWVVVLSIKVSEHKKANIKSILTLTPNLYPITLPYNQWHVWRARIPEIIHDERHISGLSKHNLGNMIHKFIIQWLILSMEIDIIRIQSIIHLFIAANLYRVLVEYLLTIHQSTTAPIETFVVYIVSRYVYIVLQWQRFSMTHCGWGWTF